MQVEAGSKVIVCDSETKLTGIRLSALPGTSWFQIVSYSSTVIYQIWIIQYVSQPFNPGSILSKALENNDFIPNLTPSQLPRICKASQLPMPLTEPKFMAQCSQLCKQ